MLKVFKYTLEINDYIEMLLPSGAKILKGDAQGEKFVIWALVNLDKPLVIRRLRLAGTGHEIKESPDNLVYINTFYSTKGLFVWHLFEII